jgi:hypothetical protein
MKRLFLFAALLAWSTLASATVYKWTDSQGKVQYGDRPPDGVHAVIVELLGVHNTRPEAPANNTAAANNTAPVRPAPPPAVTTQKAAQEKQAVDQDVAANLDKECTEAQALYKKLIDGRHLYKTGANGERTYLTSDEIDAQRLNQKQEVDSVCPSSPAQ